MTLSKWITRSIIPFFGIAVFGFSTATLHFFEEELQANEGGTTADQPEETVKDDGAKKLTEKQIEEFRKRASTPGRWKTIREEKLQRLRAIFSGEITAHAAQEKMDENAARMNTLMAQWNPVHARVDDLISLIGEPTDRDDNGRLIYVFDTGFGGTAWAFDTRNERVVGVQALRMD